MFKGLIRLLIIGTLMVSISGCLTSKGKPKPETTAGSGIVFLKEGDRAPRSGWLVNDDVMKFLYREASGGVSP